jgi:poly(hydroxyalkanoate) depolymerase family esterase
MNDHLQAAMAEATRLTRAGRLSEATATIQRALGSASTASARCTPMPHVVDADLASTRIPLRGMGPWDGARSRLTPHITGMGELQGEVLPGTGSMRRVSTPLEVGPASVPAHGQFVKKVYSTAAGTRAYQLYIPSGYHGQAAPLVVMLHGCTQTPWDFAAGTRMNVLAEGETFLVAYPEQALSANSSKCWNWFQQADQHRHRGEPALLAGITQEVIREHHLEESRVFIAGLSSGGAMAAIMAATYPDLYAAVGVHSGLAYGAAHDLPSAFSAMQRGTRQIGPRLSRPIPLIVFHGDRDTTVAPINADCVLDQWLQGLEDGANPTKRSVREATIEHGQVVGGHAYTRSIYRDAMNRAVVEKWLIHQAGHAWSGGSSAGSYTDPRGPDASAEMLRFFKEHPKR